LKRKKLVILRNKLVILNDLEIANMHAISPFSPTKVREYNNIKRISYGCSSFGYDLSLSEKDFRIFKAGKLIDPKNFDDSILESQELICDSTESYFIIPPYTSALGVSKELFSIPSDVVGVAFSKSTYARIGLITTITPLEPSWMGYLTLEMFNANSSPIKVYAGEGICQVLFFKGSEPVQKYEGKYQHQAACVVTAKV
jgi:dCTP deaminase